MRCYGPDVPNTALNLMFSYQDLLPLVLTFELPLSGRLPTDASSPTIQHIAQTCNVTITFKQVSEFIVV